MNIAVWNGKQERKVTAFRSENNIHLICECGRYDVVCQMPDNRIIYMTSNTGWKRADYDRYFDYAVSKKQWIDGGGVGDGPCFYAPTDAS